NRRVCGRQSLESKLSGRAESAAPWCLDDEYIADAHLHLAGCAELFARSVGAFHPVAAHRTRQTACDAEWRDPSMIGEHRRGHRRPKATAAFANVAPAMASRATAAAADPV